MRSRDRRKRLGAMTFGIGLATLASAVSVAVLLLPRYSTYPDALAASLYGFVISLALSLLLLEPLLCVFCYFVMGANRVCVLSEDDLKQSQSRNAVAPVEQAASAVVGAAEVTLDDFGEVSSMSSTAVPTTPRTLALLAGAEVRTVSAARAGRPRRGRPRTGPRPL